MPQNKKIRVMLVDDSAVIRGLLARTLEADKDIEVVSSVHNGQMAVGAVARARPDVVVLDIEMPVMDGITALPLILKEKPDAKILMCSTLSRQGASISMKALSLGAAECLVKPTSNTEIGGSDEFRGNLLRLVKTLGPARSAAATAQPQPPAAAKHTPPPAAAPAAPNITLRSKSQAYTARPAIIGIGSSTGGPQALFNVLNDVGGCPVPIVITQHMPKTFTAILAEHIQQNCHLPAHEGADGMALEKGHVYIAPGGHHMEIERTDQTAHIRLNEGPPENYCKPSVDPMMRSLIDAYGKKTLGIMLTGMGHDGLNSFTALAAAGGNIIAQDEKTSVVWGMPGAVAMAGLCTEIMPLAQIGPWIRKNVIEL